MLNALDPLGAHTLDPGFAIEHPLSEGDGAADHRGFVEIQHHHLEAGIVQAQRDAGGDVAGAAHHHQLIPLEAHVILH